MSEQLTGVEDFDPDVALYLIIQQLYETHDEIWGGRFREAAFGEYSALDGEGPADGSDYEDALLEQTTEFIGQQLLEMKEQNLALLAFDPESGNWHQITDVGYDTGLLSLVAQVFDPLHPVGAHLQLLGPATDLTYAPAGDEPACSWPPQLNLPTRLYDRIFDGLIEAPPLTSFLDNH